MLLRLSAAACLLPSFILLSGCANSGESSSARAYFSNATINHQPAHVILDTGSDMAYLDQGGADRFDIHIPQRDQDLDVNGSHEMNTIVQSSPANYSIGNQSFSATFPVVLNTLNDFQTTLPSRPEITFAPPPPLTLDSFSSDASLGWPEVSRNILVFDAANRTITAVPTVPPEVLGWIRLPYAFDYDGQLILDVALADGGTGHLLIDTGQPWGLAVPPAQWNTWLAAHPNAPNTFRENHFANSNTAFAREAWTDQFNLGSLTLYDLPIHAASNVEYDGDSTYLGTLGLYGLTRVDLIIDGPDRVAYLNPRPSPGFAYPGLSRPGAPPGPVANSLHPDDWLVDPSVTIAYDILYYNLARFQSYSGNYSAALASLNQALAFNPQNEHALYLRGQTKIALGDPSGALDDFNQLRLTYPNDPNINFQSAIACQILGHSIDAIVDYTLSLNHPFDDAHAAALNLYILKLQNHLGQSDLFTDLASWPSQWNKSLGQYLCGNLTQSALLDAAAADEQLSARQHCSAWYFIGANQLLNHDPAAARDSWQKCLDVSVGRFNAYQAFARADLARLDAPSTK